jgi:hypothetical protein
MTDEIRRLRSELRRARQTIVSLVAEEFLELLQGRAVRTWEDYQAWRGDRTIAIERASTAAIMRRT